jgi:hypothetical protein
MAQVKLEVTLEVETDGRVDDGLLKDMTTAGIEAVSEHICFEYDIENIVVEYVEVLDNNT